MGQIRILSDLVAMAWAPGGDGRIIFRVRPGGFRGAAKLLLLSVPFDWAGPDSPPKPRNEM